MIKHKDFSLGKCVNLQFWIEVEKASGLPACINYSRAIKWNLILILKQLEEQNENREVSRDIIGYSYTSVIISVIRELK